MSVRFCFFFCLEFPACAVSMYRQCLALVNICWSPDLGCKFYLLAAAPSVVSPCGRLQVCFGCWKIISTCSEVYSNSHATRCEPLSAWVLHCNSCTTCFLSTFVCSVAYRVHCVTWPFLCLHEALRRQNCAPPFCHSEGAGKEFKGKSKNGNDKRQAVQRHNVTKVGRTVLPPARFM